MSNTFLDAMAVRHQDTYGHWDKLPAELTKIIFLERRELQRKKAIKIIMERLIGASYVEIKENISHFYDFDQYLVRYRDYKCFETTHGVLELKTLFEKDIQIPKCFFFHSFIIPIML